MFSQKELFKQLSQSVTEGTFLFQTSSTGLAGEVVYFFLFLALLVIWFSGAKRYGLSNSSRG